MVTPNPVRWGFMPDWAEDDIGAEYVPLAWKPLDGSPVTREGWEFFRDAVIAEISDLLWPQYRIRNGIGAWEGAALPMVDEMEKADFDLLAGLRECLKLPVQGLSELPQTHDELFKSEDTQALGLHYEEYEPLAPVGVSKLIVFGFFARAGSFHLQLKRAFQRPRPYQVAMARNLPDFKYRQADSAATPSLVSGHAMQGVLGGCSAYTAFLDRGSTNPDSMRALRQFSVDVGDRRVFAGVHYPSDNLSSWYAALRIIPYSFQPPSRAAEVVKFLGEAISQSVVYSRISKHIADNPNSSPYQKCVVELEKLSNGAISPPSPLV